MVLKKVLPKSISSRFFLILIAPVIVSQLIFGAIFLGKYMESVMKGVAQQIAGEIWVVSSILDLGCSDSYIDEIQKNMGMSISTMSRVHLKKTGIAKNSKVYRLLRNACRAKNIRAHYIKPYDNKILVYVESKDGKSLYKILIPRKTMYTKIIPIVLGWGVASSIVALIIAFLFLQNQIKPIKKLTKAVEKFGLGEEGLDFKPEGATEVRLAGKAFCDMRINFRKLMDSKIRSLAEISHDLKTPLTKMKLQLSIMPASSEVEFLKRDVEDMVKITESFMLHAAQSNKEVFIHRNLRKFLDELATDYLTSEFNIQVIGDVSIEICMKQIALKRAFGNIIGNARKFSAELTIQFFSKKDNEIEITFEDNGPGISEEIIHDIFSPFVSSQGTQSFGREVSIGLGLSIVRDIITEHGGNIFVENSARHGGARFIVTLLKEQ
jgi:two-component system osmolarity sensor histidine kinase EnvZ